MNILLAIKGHIYEVKNFINKHPGEGISNIFLSEHNRQEVSELFEKFHQTNVSEEHLINARENTNEHIQYVAPNYFKRRIPKYYHYIPAIGDVNIQELPIKSFFMYQSNEDNKDGINLLVKDGMGLLSVHHMKLKINDETNKLEKCFVELCSDVDENDNVITTILDEATIEDFVDKYFIKDKYTPIVKLKQN